VKLSDSPEKVVESLEEGQEVTESAEEESSDTPARILVVDDEEVVCRFLESLLTRVGHQVQTCLSGREAIAKLREGSVDLVITDLKMPAVDGLSVLREAKQLDPFCEVIIITAYGSVESAVEVMKLGAYDYIAKPFNIEHVRVVVDKAIEKRRLLQAAEERDLYKRLAQLDGLTELYNYRTFYELLEAEIARAERYLHPLSVLMIDLDDLKVYNDTFGHPAGDAILREVAWLLRRSVRNCDVVARYGGDEFAIILPETSKEDATGIADRIRRMVEGTSFEHDDVLPHKTVTISVGLASFPTDAGETTELVSKADQALYEAKTLGGNLLRTAKFMRSALS
jgi:diguanylate cyclase (GGDEF)-like protein